MVRLWFYVWWPWSFGTSFLTLEQEGCTVAALF